jgi:hypothetical protein
MALNIPADLQRPVNQSVLRYLEGQSAHSDVAEALIQALKPLGDVQRFCPNPAQYRYVLASTRGIVFAVALGMAMISFRLDDRMRARALACGAEPLPDCGPDWVSFTLFRDDWPKTDLEFWARKAYVSARETAA